MQTSRLMGRIFPKVACKYFQCTDANCNVFSYCNLNRFRWGFRFCWQRHDFDKDNFFCWLYIYIYFFFLYIYLEQYCVPSSKDFSDCGYFWLSLQCDFFIQAFLTDPVAGVAGAVLKTPLSLIKLLINSSFYSKPLKHHYNQTVIARELKCWENVHPPPRVTCQVSGVMCQVSNVRCHVSHVMCHVSCVRFQYL